MWGQKKVPFAASSPSTEHIVAQEERGSDCDSSTHVQRLCLATLSHQGLYWKSWWFISVWKLFANRENYIYTYILYVYVCGGLVGKSGLTLATPWTVWSLSVSSLPGTYQAGILEWVAISFSMYMCMSVYIYIHMYIPMCVYIYIYIYIHVCMYTQLCLFAAPLTVAPRLLCPWNFPGKNAGVGRHFPTWGIEPSSLMSPAPTGRFF